MKKLLLFFIFIIDLVFNPFCNFIISAKERWTSFTWNNLWYFFCEITTVFLRTLIAEEACLFFRFSAKYYFKKNMKSKKYIVLHAKKMCIPVYIIYILPPQKYWLIFLCVTKFINIFLPFLVACDQDDTIKQQILNIDWLNTINTGFQSFLNIGTIH